MAFDIVDLLGRTNAEARPYQQRIVNRCMEAWTTKNLRSVMIESPTGSGKTIMALLAAKALQEHHAARGEDLEIGWISMRRNLLAQAENENRIKAIDANIHFLSMFEKHLPEELLHVLPSGRPSRRAAKHRMLIIDEAQHDAANSMASIHANVKPQYILGMTATPFRTDHVKLCFDTVLKDAGLATLIRDGYLAQYHHYTIPEWRVDRVVDCFLAEQQKWGKSIFYFFTLDQCAQAVARLRNAGVSTEFVTGSSDRESQIERFRAGEVTALVNCMVLTEGFDCPDLKTVFCRPSCKGVTIQMCGRAFRKHPSCPYKQVVQAKKGWPFVKLAVPQAHYVWEKGEWRSLQVNTRIHELSCKMLATLAGINTQLPEFITKAALSKRGRSRRRGI